MTAETSSPAHTVHPVDLRLPSGKLAALGLQHVLVMYAGGQALVDRVNACGGGSFLGRGCSRHMGFSSGSQERG